jgi:predicted nucleic-acid-binding Zn-ribbon protein
MKQSYDCSKCGKENTIEVTGDIFNKLKGGFGSTGIMSGEFGNFGSLMNSSNLLSSDFFSSKHQKPVEYRDNCKHCGATNILTF